MSTYIEEIPSSELSTSTHEKGLFENQDFNSPPIAKVQTQKSLRFDSITNLTYWVFLKESIFYILTYVSHKLLSVLVHVLFGVYDRSDLIGKVSFAVISLDLFSSGLRDFQIPVGIICGPLYSKQDFLNYKVQRNKLALINTVLYLAFATIWPLLPALYRFMGVHPENLEDILVLSKWYILVYGPLMAVTNFLKGAIFSV